MHETADHDAAADRTEGEPVWVNADGLTVEKVPVSRGPAVVAVHLTLRSSRDVRSLVRVVDPLPSEVGDKVVEFHPAYDPDNWSKSDEEVVYEAPMEPRGERTTVYGVEVDDAEQRELFSTPPKVESAVLGESADGDEQPASAGSATQAAGDGSGASPATESTDAPSATDGPATEGAPPFTFAPKDGSTDGSADGSTATPTGPSRDVADHATAQLAQVPEASPSDRSVLDALVVELERRDLNEAERKVIRDAVSPGRGTDVDPSLERLQERVADHAEARESLAESVHRVEAGYDSLRDEIAAADRQAADVDRLESRLDAMAEEVEAVTENLEELRESFDEEVRWRTDLRRHLSSDPADESP